MSKKTARCRIDPRNLPLLTRAQKAELTALKAASDSDIDCSDIPGLTEKFWRNAARNPYLRPIKQGS
jgi:hypothetical protein